MTPEEIRDELSETRQAITSSIGALMAASKDLGDIRRALEAAGISAPAKDKNTVPKRKRQVDYNKILEDSVDGLSQREIAERHNITSGAVNKILKKARLEQKIVPIAYWTKEGYPTYRQMSDGTMQVQKTSGWYPSNLRGESGEAKLASNGLNRVDSTRPPENS